MPDETITFTDLVRGEITYLPENVPDFGIVRANGAPLYTLVNPVDDALMEITHVLRGEDLLSSTPRQIALYKALIELGIAKQTPAFGHLPYVMGEGNKKLSKRDPQASLNLYRERGFLPEGLLNYLSLLGWSLSADQDIFSIEEMVAAFDIADVNPNPARFDLKKAEAINGDHIRLLDVKDFARALRPLAEGPVRPLGAGGLRRGGVGGDRPARADPPEGPLRDHGQRRLPVPAGAGLRRGVLDEGHEGGQRRACCVRPARSWTPPTGRRPTPSRRPSWPPARSTASSSARRRPRSASPSPAARSACRSSSPWRSWARRRRWPASTRPWRSCG